MSSREWLDLSKATNAALKRPEDEYLEDLANALARGTRSFQNIHDPAGNEVTFVGPASYLDAFTPAELITISKNICWQATTSELDLKKSARQSPSGTAVSAPTAAEQSA